MRSTAPIKVTYHGPLGQATVTTVRRREVEIICDRLLDAVRRFNAGMEIPAEGICEWVGRLNDSSLHSDFKASESSYSILNLCFTSWPMYSGDRGYPIPGGRCSFYQNTDNAWWIGSNYCLQRWALVNHSIRTLQKLARLMRENPNASELYLPLC